MCIKRTNTTEVYLTSGHTQSILRRDGEGKDRTEEFSEYHEVAVQPSVDTAGFCQNDSGLLLPPWDNGGVGNRGGDSGVKDNCLLECTGVNNLGKKLVVRSLLMELKGYVD